MRRVGFGLVLLTTVFARASACQTRPDVPTPTVTAKGSAGDEDVPDLTIRQVNLKAGETLLVSCSDEGGDAEVYWGKRPSIRTWLRTEPGSIRRSLPSTAPPVAPATSSRRMCRAAT